MANNTDTSSKNKHQEKQKQNNNNNQRQKQKRGKDKNKNNNVFKFYMIYTLLQLKNKKTTHFLHCLKVTHTTYYVYMSCRDSWIYHILYFQVQNRDKIVKITLFTPDKNLLKYCLLFYSIFKVKVKNVNFYHTDEFSFF